MADMNPELAFLNQQDEYDPSADYTSAPTGGEGDNQEQEEEYDPSVLDPSHMLQQNDAPVPSPSDQSASMPESSGNTPLPTNEDALKPQPTDTAAATTAAAVPTPSKQPRTMGGFVDESEDDEDEVPVAKAAGSALLNASGESSTPQRSLTETPNNTLPTSTNVPLLSAQDQGHSGVSSSISVTANDAAPIVASSLPGAGAGTSTPAPDATKIAGPEQVKAASAQTTTASATPAPAALPKPRLPQDRVGILEDRTNEDPRGDIDAWLELIAEHRKRHKFDEARATYDKFFNVFPHAAEQWIEYVNMETEADDLNRVERLFERSILATPHVELWSTYINYIRRRNNLTTDATGNARQIITQVYEFVLENVGIDISSGRIWHDYIEFIKTGPGVLGGNDWQSQQKMDTLRKVYHRAIAVPTNALLEIWREYDRFELTSNKASGRKILQDKSPFYMTARSANNMLDNLTRGIHRTTLPKLPPRPGFAGYDEYMAQVAMWKKWIQWEKEDPLVLEKDDRTLFNKRIIYLYKHALMALRFWPDLWYEATEWCFQNNLTKEGNEFLDQGMAANPESCLLALRKAHQIEFSGEFEESEQGVLKKGETIYKEAIEKVLDALYDLIKKTKEREDHVIARTKENFKAQKAAEEVARATSEGDFGDDGEQDVNEAQAVRRAKEQAEALDAQVQGISNAYNEQTLELKRTISYVWIAHMRIMRRVQGKGSMHGSPPGFRGTFALARQKGQLLSDVYTASALIEHHCYQDQAAAKIFDRGVRLYPEDEKVALEYLKHLINQNDETNARVIFEKTVGRITQKPENVDRAKPLFKFFHQYESQFGELAQVVKLEKRMSELWPQDPQLSLFAERYSTPTFDPTTTRPIISPKTQMRPAMMPAMMPRPTIEEQPAPAPVLHNIQEKRPSPMLNSPRVPPAGLHATNSPKRPFDDGEADYPYPRKLARGESPIKGAAGRRLAAAKAGTGRSDGATVFAPAADLPMDVRYLLSIIPAAHTYKETRFSPEALVRYLQTVDLNKPNQTVRPQFGSTPVPGSASTQAPPSFQPSPMAWGPPSGIGSYYGR
ncbi:hypothetical protein BCR34DRAFT_512149 [Clohesyomyces aquaticus]|uniref:mRNA 3'-end-processing protein RNA14 n=1 Tax=Clohesyomyces aquaticus TaxID=1231657 RepID=A0A1Y1ZR55_9PLEO|nr:hypothetical protein BCR34DRAFT_512149 [Clohesyomyces aquaticus]